jgi:hypothetical protein
MLHLILATLLQVSSASTKSPDVQKAETEEADAQKAGKAVNWSAAGEAWLVAAKKQKNLQMQEHGMACLEKSWQLAENDEKEFLRTRFRNIVKVPAGFEKPNPPGTPSGWASFDANWGCTIESRFGHSGTCSAKLTPAKEDLKKDLNGWSTLTSTKIQVSPGKAYALTLWVFSLDTDEAGDISLQWRDASGAKLSGVQTMIPKDSPFWKKIELKGEAPAGAAGVFIRLDLKITRGALWVDDVSLLDGGQKDLLQNGSFEKR